MSLCQQNCREVGISRESAWRASRPDAEGKAVCEECPLVHRIQRKEMAAERASERREKQGGAGDHCSQNNPGVQSATSQALVFSHISFTQVAGVGRPTAYFAHLKQSRQNPPITSNPSLQ